ncbi:rRNA pseudouridine synthase [Arachidicoccus terrestris]|nr:rRNA pseudouridine synthase [Arachidicoccus terrestris]
MPLNKFIAHSGICGRREAAELVKLGQVQVNGDIVFEPATKVSEKDTIQLKGKKLNIQVKHYYFLLNKPKDHITTTKDEKGRRTVLDLFKDVDARHLYPVGRLDRNTTGVLLITNDGELAQQLTHPSFEVKKIYEATLDRPLAKKDLDAIAGGLTLEDGEIKADQVGYPDAKNKAVIGIEIHSGKNRIVRRIFEHLGYEVKKLDRVMFAGLTKKNVERGKWRYLSEKEIRVLKYMNAGGTKKSKKAAAIEAAMQAPTLIPAKRTRIPTKTDGRPTKKVPPGRKATSKSEIPAKKATRKNAPATGKTTRKEKH